MEATATPETTLLEPAAAEMTVANFLVEMKDGTGKARVSEMGGHLRRIIKLLEPNGEQGVLATLTRALGRDAPAASRRYDTIWSIDTLFDWIELHWPGNEALPLRDLQTKTMMLIMAFSACRLAELGRMERPTAAKEDTSVVTLHTILKQRQTQRQQITVRRISRRGLCPVEAVLTWLRRTAAVRRERLFYTEGGHGSRRNMTTPDICPRFLAAMKAAGIPQQYTAYSLKHAVITKLYRMGATDEQVVEYGHWAKGSTTPRKWYNIATLEEEWLGTKLLGQSLGMSEDRIREKFTDRYLPPTRTVRQAEERAATSEALATPLPALNEAREVGEEEEQE
jgi:hypothetical protein